jgi:hypothetical protein
VKHADFVDNLLEKTGALHKELREAQPPGSKLQVPSSKSQSPSSQFPKSQMASPKSQVPGRRSQVPSPRFQVPGPRFQVAGPKSHVQGSTPQVPSSKSRVPGPRFQAPGPKSQVPSPRPHAPSSASQVPGRKSLTHWLGRAGLRGLATVSGYRSLPKKTFPTVAVPHPQPGGCHCPIAASATTLEHSLNPTDPVFFAHPRALVPSSLLLFPPVLLLLRSFLTRGICSLRSLALSGVEAPTA